MSQTADDIIQQYEADTTAMEYQYQDSLNPNNNSNNNTNGNLSVFVNSGTKFFGLIEQGMASLTKNPIKVQTTVKEDNKQLYMILAVVAGIFLLMRKK